MLSNDIALKDEIVFIDYESADSTEEVTGQKVSYSLVRLEEEST